MPRGMPRRERRMRGKEEVGMSRIRLNHIYKSYQGNEPVVKDFNLDIKEKEFIVFVGPSGCGKSTVLRMIAGLEEITGGELWMDGKLMNYEKPGARNVSMVFQNYALYPHMSVYDNLAFSLQIRGVSKKEIKKKVTDTVQILGIETLLDRKPAQLSGGQKQRVAIGSAILRKPDAFLMDEPLSNLDAKMRMQMRSEIAALYNRLETTFIYVTHDQTEAMTLGTRIVVLKEGEIQQIDTPKNLYEHPASKFVAGFIGSPSMNFIPAKVDGDASGIRILPMEKEDGRTPDFSMNAGQCEVLKRLHYEYQEVTLGIRPKDFCFAEDVSGTKGNMSSPVRLPVIGTELLGASQLVYFALGGAKCVADLPAEHVVSRGDTIELCMDMDRIQLFDIHSERNLFCEAAER